MTKTGTTYIHKLSVDAGKWCRHSVKSRTDRKPLSRWSALIIRSSLAGTKQWVGLNWISLQAFGIFSPEIILRWRRPLSGSSGIIWIGRSWLRRPILPRSLSGFVYTRQCDDGKNPLYERADCGDVGRRMSNGKHCRREIIFSRCTVWGCPPPYCTGARFFSSPYTHTGSDVAWVSSSKCWTNGVLLIEQTTEWRLHRFCRNSVIVFRCFGPSLILLLSNFIYRQLGKDGRIGRLVVAVARAGGPSFHFFRHRHQHDMDDWK